MTPLNTAAAKKLSPEVRRSLYGEFRSWNASVTEISKKKAVYELREGCSETRKVCMYRDGCHVYVYGDYGSFDFDSVSWTASPVNLRYDNLPYQFEKLSERSRESIMIYEPHTAVSDIEGWLFEILESECEMTAYKKRKVKELLNDPFGQGGIVDICPALGDLADLVDAAADLVEAALQGREFLLAALSENASVLQDYDEEYYRLADDCGREVAPNVWISLLALSVLGTKIKKMKRGEGDWRVLYGKGM